MLPTLTFHSILLFLLVCSTGHAKPTSSIDRASLLPPPSASSHNLPKLNAEDISLFTTMFLNLFKGIGDWRNMVAADAVQSVWQSPPIIDLSKRIFATT